MTNQQRDTEVSLFLRFHTSRGRQESLVKMVGRVGGFDALHHLSGLSHDSGNVDMIFEMPLNRASLREDVSKLQSFFLRLYDFHPAISEPPSDAQCELADEYLKSHEPQRQLQNA